MTMCHEEMRAALIDQHATRQAPAGPPPPQLDEYRKATNSRHPDDDTTEALAPTG